jgi:RNA polymerase sigma-70 factor, ECF subfamily
VIGDGRPGFATVEMLEPTDLDLLRRIGRGDEDAFRVLFRRYAPNAHGLALRVLRQAFQAEEAVQDAFVAVWRNAGSYDPSRGSVRAWLLGMVHNRAVDLVRREQSQRRRAEVVVIEDVVADPAERVVEAIGSIDERAKVREALAALPADQRQVIELMYFQGLSQSRIAEHLSLPLGTVKSRTLLGMRRIRGSLAGMER